MTDPGTTSRQATLRGLAMTALLVAGGLYLAVRLVLVIAHVLIAIVLVVAVIYGVVCFERYRRSRW